MLETNLAIKNCAIFHRYCLNSPRLQRTAQFIPHVTNIKVISCKRSCACLREIYSCLVLIAFVSNASSNVLSVMPSYKYNSKELSSYFRKRQLNVFEF